jgi:beta-xylosidase
MYDWLCFSSTDLLHWQAYPSPLKATDFAWARGDAYASWVVERGGRFYWYVAVTHAGTPGKAIGVAVADTPTGPFRDAIGKPLIGPELATVPGSDNFDPSVFVDTDGQAYIFWGKNTCYYAPLEAHMTELAGAAKTVELPLFMEGIHVHRHNNWYYLSYGYGFPEKVGYAMSRSIHGPWQFMGVLNEIPGNCETNRPAVLAYKGRHYFFYHNGALENGGSHRRSVCVDELFYNEDGSIRRIRMTSEGVGAV